MNINDDRNKKCGWTDSFQSNIFEIVNNVNGIIDVTDMLLGIASSSSKYPPRNIKQYKFNDRVEHIIEFALAGFKKSEIKVTKNGKFIEVSGSKTPVSTNGEKSPFVMENGISFKSFNQRFELNTLVDSVSDYQISSKFEDGLLTIKIVKAITPKQSATEINID